MGLPKLTRQQANQKLLEQGRHEEVECVGELDGYKKKTTWKCAKCEHVWESTPHTVLTTKHGCPSCKLISNVAVDEILLFENIPIKRIDNVTKAQDPITWECRVCCFQWVTNSNKILNQRTGCPKCANKAKLTNEIIDKRLEATNLPIKRVGDVCGTHNRIMWQCAYNPSHEWKTTPVSIIINNTGCPHCYGEAGNRGIPTTIDGITFRSKLEADTYVSLREYTERNSYTLELQRRYRKESKHTCDFYIPEIKTWIEISNYTYPSYVKTIERKRAWVTESGEQFLFASCFEDLCLD